MWLFKLQGNNYQIITLALIGADFVFDIAFLYSNGDDVPSLFMWRYETKLFLFSFLILIYFSYILNTIILFCFFFKKNSLLIIVVSAVFNFILVTILIIREKRNPSFNEWSEENAFVTKVITLFSVADIEALTFLNSQFAGSSMFAAPFSENIKKLIFYGGCVNLFIEDIPQLVIQVKY